MAFRVSPTDPDPTHHILFTDKDGTQVGLIVSGKATGDPDETLLNKRPTDQTAMKIKQGSEEYGDLQPPYYTIKQDDFSGGRGSRDFESDTTRFADAGGLNTRRPGFVHLGGQEQLGARLRNGGQIQPGNILYPNTILPGGPVGITEWCVKIKPNVDGTYDQVWIYSYLPQGDYSVKIYDGALPAFDTLVTSFAGSIPVQLSPGWQVYNLNPGFSATAANGVWVSIVFTTTTQYQLIARDTATSGFVKQDGLPVADYGFPVRLMQKKEPEFCRIFEYKHCLYLCQEIAGVVHLWLIGERGTLTAGATGTGTDASKAWTVDELAGGIFYVIGGTGINEKRRWRKIENNTGTVVTFSDGYTAALAAGTEYVIVNLNKAYEIGLGGAGDAAHGLTRVTDILVSNDDAVYFAQGTGTPIRRMREFTSVGVWSRFFATDGTNEADYLAIVGQKLWRARNSTGGVSSSPIPAPSVDLTFGTDVLCGEKYSPFTGLCSYVDETGERSLFVFKEETTGPVKNDAEFLPIRIDLKSVRSEKNGRAHLVYDGNLYFTVGNGLERYYYPDVSDMGPNRDEGLPSNRQGPIVALDDYAGRFFVGIDAGTTGLSCVMSSGGWHEEWRGPYGMRLYDVYAQPIPGVDLDRLWVAYGGDLNWVPLSSETTNPLRDANYIYNPGGYLETSQMFTDMKLIKKYISKLKTFVEEHPGMLDVWYSIDGGAFVQLLQLSDATPGSYLDGIVWTAPAAAGGVPPSVLECFSLQIRVYLRTENKTQTPVLRALVTELLARIENKYSYEIPFVLDDPPRDLNGNLDPNLTTTTILTYLKYWCGSDINPSFSAGPLYMQSTNPEFDGRMVWLLPFQYRVVQFDKPDGRRAYIGALTVQDA